MFVICKIPYSIVLNYADTIPRLNKRRLQLSLLLYDANWLIPKQLAQPSTFYIPEVCFGFVLPTLTVIDESIDFRNHTHRKNASMLFSMTVIWIYVDCDIICFSDFYFQNPDRYSAQGKYCSREPNWFTWNSFLYFVTAPTDHIFMAILMVTVAIAAQFCYVVPSPFFCGSLLRKSYWFGTNTMWIILVRKQFN